MQTTVDYIAAHLRSYSSLVELGAPWSPEQDDGHPLLGGERLRRAHDEGNDW